MSFNRQSAVVDYTLRELYYRNESETKHARFPQVLTLLTGHIGGMEQAVTSLQILRKYRMRVRIYAEKNTLHHRSRNEWIRATRIDDWISFCEAEQWKENLDMVFVPVLPFSLVSDLLQLNERRPFVRLLLWALMRGKKVIALSFGVNPYHSVWHEAGLDQGSAPLKQEMQKQYQRVRGFGIRFVNDCQELVNQFQPKAKKKVLTATDIKEFYQNSRNEIFIDKETILTPLAKDTAKEYQILIHSGQGEDGSWKWES